MNLHRQLEERPGCVTCYSVTQCTGATDTEISRQRRRTLDSTILSLSPPPHTRTTPSFRESNPSPFDHVSKEIGDDGDNARRYTLEQSTLYSTILLLYQLNLPSTTLLPYQLNRPSRPTSSPLNTEQIHTHTNFFYKKMCF